ncbi:hypothetical protein P8452_15430 [Trifolium repens]|nr:hypothetical protein QL285_055372 [Trifolium repens]WJX26519.1 hypothetical protein P8452_15430 [Trifolium repens]
MDLTLVNLSPYLTMSGSDSEIASLCREVSSSLKEKGALLIKDPRCSVEDVNNFVSMIEKYFCSPMEYKLGHQRSNYQAGITPEGVETPRCMSDKDMQEKMKELLEENRPSAPLGPDVKWRYSWTPQNRSQEPVIPEGFPEWEERMDLWGNKMIAALEVVAEMAALGFGFPKDAFTSLMNQVSTYQFLLCDWPFCYII